MSEHTLPHETDCLFLQGDKAEAGGDRVIREEPLLIRVNGEPLAALMRLPGDDIDLAVGYLITEGIAKSLDEILQISHCEDGALGDPNVVDVRIASMLDAEAVRQARRQVFSSCGICSAEAISDLCKSVGPFALPDRRLDSQGIRQAMESLRARQPLFESTGGAHAALLVRRDELADPNAGIVREDIGRHNAVDKVVGAAAKARWPLGETLVLLSGRVSYEIVAKAARAGIADLAAVSAATTLAIETARALNMFLAAFVRGDRMNVYSCGAALVPYASGRRVLPSDQSHAGALPPCPE